MESLFSPKMKSQAQLRSSGKKSKRIPYLTSQGSKLSFPKMRRRKPSSISISVENGDVILGDVASTSRTTHAESSWCPTTSTPYTVPCMGSGCVEGNAFYALMPISSRSVCPCYWHASTVYQCEDLSQNYYSAAELPGSFVAPPGAIELDVPSTVRTPSFAVCGDQIPGSPLDSSPTSAESATRELNEHQSTCVLLEEPRRNDILISSMSFEELLDILPELSPEEIREFWQPAMSRRVATSRGDSRSGQQPILAFVSGLKDAENEPSVTERFRRTKSVPNICLTPNRGESTQQFEDCDARIGALRGFTLGHNVSASGDNNESAVSDVKEITAQQLPRRIETSFSEFEKAPQIQAVDTEGLQARVSLLEDLTSRQKMELKKQRDEIKILKQDIKAYEREERRMALQMREKDAQIALLNSKVAQLLTMGANMFPSSVDLRLDKNLPSPVPSDCGSITELQPQIDALRSRFSFCNSVDTFDVVNEGPMYKRRRGEAMIST